MITQLDGRDRGEALIWIKPARYGAVGLPASKFPAGKPPRLVRRADRAAYVVTMALRVFRQNRSGEEVIQLSIRLGLLAALVYWCFVIVSPFIPILAWAVVLAVALYPLYGRLSDRLGQRPRLAAALITLVAVAIVIGPAA